MRLNPLLLGVALLATSRIASAQQTVALGDRDRFLEGAPQELFRVGENDAREEEQFARVAATAFDRDDNLFVLDAQNNRVVVFDKVGTFVRTFGRKGAGPGELSAPVSMVMTADGHLVVLDRGNRALVVYSRDGQHVRNVPIDQSLGLGGRFMVAHPTAGVVFALNPGLRIENGAPQFDTTGIKVYWQQSLAEGTTPILVHSVPEPKGPAPQVTQQGNARMMMRQAPPAFTPQVHFALLGDGSLAFNNTDSWRLDVIGGGGRVTRSLQRPFAARKVTQADKELEVKRRVENLRNGGARVVMSGGAATTSMSQMTEEQLRHAQQRMVENMQFAETVPVIQGLYTDPTGRIWVARSQEPGKPTIIDLVGADGRYIGSIRDEGLPSSVSPNGLAAYIGTSDLDVPIVMVRRLPHNRGS